MVHNIFQATTISTDNGGEQQQGETMYPMSLDESSVIRWNATTRTAHVVSILPAAVASSINATKIVNPYWIFLQVTAFLAMEHFNMRDTRLVPRLGHDDMQACDLQLTMEILDSNMSPIVASRKLMNSIYGGRPAAIAGAFTSAVSEPTSLLSSIHKIPQISPTASSAALEDRDSSPYFGRTIPTNDGDARALLYYLSHYLGVKQLGVLSATDPYGREFARSIERSARTLEVQPILASYIDGQESSVHDAIERLRESSVRYIFAILNSRNWQRVMELAVDAGIAGNSQHVWIFSDTGASFPQEAVTNPNLATREKIFRAMQGAGLIELYLSIPQALNDAYEEFLQQPSKQQQHWSILDDQKTIQKQFRFSEASLPPDSPDFPLVYDAIMALGLAACQTDEEFFTGPQLYKSFLNTSFHGASGEVHFDSQKGTRSVQGLNYAILNFIREQDDDNITTFRSELSSIIHFDGNNIGDSNSASSIQIVSPFVYWDGSTTPPAQFPPLVVNMTLISTPVIVVGLVFCGIAMMMSIGWAIFTFRFRKRPVLVMAQPPFLYMTCIGTFIMAASIIPMSFQEPLSQSILDFGCMAQLWTLAIGFTTVFSALFCKMWRLNKVLGNAQHFRRVKVKMKDVTYPFVLLLSLNVVVLLGWTFVDPMVWTRSALDSVDRFGRPNVTVGRCRSGDRTNQAVFQSLYVVVNLAAAVIAIHQSYKARKHPLEYNESEHIILTMGCLLEEAIVGLPVAVSLSDDDTEAHFLVLSVLVSLMCVSVLLPTFIPKYTKRKLGKRQKSDPVRRLATWRSTTTRSPSNNNSNSWTAMFGRSFLRRDGPPQDPEACARPTMSRVGSAKHVENLPSLSSIHGGSAAMLESAGSMGSIVLSEIHTS